MMTCLVCIFTGDAIGTVTTPFDSGLGGWTSNTPAEIVWEASGGNPGGYARFTDATPNHTYLIAPPEYLGDWSGLDGAGSISYDHNVIWLTGSAFAPVPYTVRISGPGGEATWSGAIAPRRPGWTRVTAPISEPSWSVGSGRWDDILTEVQTLSIRIEQFSNMDITGLDSIVLTAPRLPEAPEPGPAGAGVPEPATLCALALAVAGLGRYVRRRPKGTSLSGRRRC